MTKNEFLDLICFCILMENNQGIMGKSPRYVIEKFETRQPSLLDHINGAKFLDYCKYWEKSIGALPEE